MHHTYEKWGPVIEGGKKEMQKRFDPKNYTLVSELDPKNIIHLLYLNSLLHLAHNI
jgi:hypothetical protein